jgi:predicted nucleic acid-binding protein
LKVYVDTSFLISLYSLDANSAAAARSMQASSATHVISTLCELEVANALELRVFRKDATATQVRKSAKAFAKDMQDGLYQMSVLSDEMLEKARQLSRQFTARLGTRTADVLHVAAALELSADAIFSFDARQRELAKAVGLKVNPL